MGQPHSFHHSTYSLPIGGMPRRIVIPDRQGIDREVAVNDYTLNQLRSVIESSSASLFQSAGQSAFTQPATQSAAQSSLASSTVGSQASSLGSGTSQQPAAVGG